MTFFRLLFFLTAWGVVATTAAWAQNVAINADGSAPNANAMLDIQSPGSGDGRGLLIPRVTAAQRTTADAGLPGGLLDDAGNLRGRAAQGLLVYQTDGIQGFYYNASTTAAPAWLFLSTDKYLPIRGSTVAVGDGAVVSNNGVGVGLAANGERYGTAVGYQSNADTNGSALGYRANARMYGAALGYQANGYDNNVAVGYYANAYTGAGPYAGSVSVGYRANGFSGDGIYTGAVAVGYRANARHNFNEDESGAVAVGYSANAFIRGAALGWSTWGYNQGVALGYEAWGANYGVGVGYGANGYTYGTAVGYRANSGGNDNYALAKGAYSKCVRYNEEWKSGDGSDNRFGYGQVNFHGTTTWNSATEIFLGGVSSRRFAMADDSAVTFSMLVTGINTNTGDSSSWRIWGGIKQRGGAATTALVDAVGIEAKTQGGLTTDPVVTADTVNGSLRLQVTGVTANTVLWNAAMTYSEVRENAR